MEQDILNSIQIKKKNPNLELAPLIDMIFILLIFFMLTTTLVQQTGIEVKKPKAISSQLLPRRNILITITKEKDIFLEGKKMGWQEFKQALADRINKSPESMVIINTDMDSKIGIIVDVMDEAKKSGARKLSIATVYERWDEEE